MYLSINLYMLHGFSVMEDVCQFFNMNFPDMKKSPCLDSGGLFGDCNRAKPVKAKAGEAEGRQSV